MGYFLSFEISGLCLSSGIMTSSLLHSSTNCRFSCFQIVFENVYPSCDLVTLEHLKELSSKRKAIEDSINESSFITEAIAKEMSGGLESRFEQVTVYDVLNIFLCTVCKCLYLLL